MPTTHAVNTSASPVIRREDAVLRRRMKRFPKRVNSRLDDVKRAYLLTLNVLPDIERAGRLDRVNRELARIHGCGWQKTELGPVILQGLQDYREKREKSQKPLRKKSWARLKHVPLVGDAYAQAMKILRTQGVHGKNVETAMLLCHDHGGYSIHYTLRVTKVVPDDVKRLSRVYHKGRVQDIGLCVTPTGLDIVITQADGKKDLLRKVAIEDLIKPGFVQDLYRHVIAPKANTVALDETFVPRLSGALRDANAQIRRWLRSRQAVGAIVFAVVSPISREIDDALPFAKQAGVSRNTLRLMKALSVQKCPCGAPADLRLDPVTLIPVLRRTKCVECGALMDTGHVLATRASAYVLDNWRTYGHAGVPARIRLPRQHRPNSIQRLVQLEETGPTPKGNRPPSEFAALSKLRDVQGKRSVERFQVHGTSNASHPLLYTNGRARGAQHPNPRRSVPEDEQQAGVTTRGSIR